MKPERLKKLDRAFIAQTMAEERHGGDRRKASDHMITVGFGYLYGGDLVTAMYRFNQAYLLDSTNTDIYWGYGGVYMTLGKYDEARVQYEEGLEIDPENTHLLTDLGTYYTVQYQKIGHKSELLAAEYLHKARAYFLSSYELDPRDQNTLYKLSVNYFASENCKEAWKYHLEGKALGGKQISPGFDTAMEHKCADSRPASGTGDNR